MTGKAWAHFLKDTLLDMFGSHAEYSDRINCVGYRDGRAVVFVDTLEVAGDVQKKLHHTLVRGYLLRIRHEDRDDELDGFDMNPEIVDAYKSLHNGCSCEDRWPCF